ncbi:hypothetical protein HZS61_004862 [Fusarium oxysporum f. sp. conglutinans]|uniref:Uncharacterized protein n=1 Tax=Fusarium oxysporum f. sp. conglutinans TaxID=100902 RepID=A0A8H6LEF2_FUSOX|nr:hypothetical protein HZS61_004862 [Fusarium oxysporum f. sp. conglutinans]
MTTKDTIDRLWNEGLSSKSNFDDTKDKKPYHEFPAGTFQNFECAPECIERGLTSQSYKIMNNPCELLRL